MIRRWNFAANDPTMELQGWNFCSKSLSDHMWRIAKVGKEPQPVWQFWRLQFPDPANNLSMTVSFAETGWFSSNWTTKLNLENFLEALRPWNPETQYQDEVHICAARLRKNVTLRWLAGLAVPGYEGPPTMVQLTLFCRKIFALSRPLSASVFWKYIPREAHLKEEWTKHNFSRVFVSKFLIPFVASKNYSNLQSCCNCACEIDPKAKKEDAEGGKVDPPSNPLSSGPRCFLLIFLAGCPSPSQAEGETASKDGVHGEKKKGEGAGA